MDFPFPLSILNWLALGLLAIAIAITALGFRPAAAFLRAHIHGSIFEMLRKYAYTFVAALEQDPTLKGLASEEKKQQAIIWLIVKANQLGLTITESEASQIVEEAVYLVKRVALPHFKDTLQVS